MSVTNSRIDEKERLAQSKRVASRRWFWVIALIYINGFAITYVLAPRHCGPELTISTPGWADQRSCVHSVFMKAYIWPGYWLYRFWKLVL